ncbi:DMT family transporter [Peribacillus glennii]|uniref:DMT family transporter n=1 Tax=Peribacillus glennii TaxID=2303991 RepID=A0A372LHP1_9BACI|nr:DMT family transporter [Peribacillus glennii]RFU65482.1 DMT family transporter [Peribacillus glennii]
MKKTSISDFTLLFVVFIWGATFVMVQNAISFLEPFSFNAVRFLMAFLLLLVWYLLFSHKKMIAWNTALLFSGAKLGLWLFLGYAFQTFGLLYTSPAKAGFITGLSVVLVPLFSLALIKQKPTRNALLGVTAATLGLYLMTVVENSSFTIGDVLVFLCAISFAMHIITTARFAGVFPALPLTIVQIFTVSLLSFISGAFFEDFSVVLNPGVMLKTEVWLALFVTSSLATAFAFLAQTYFQAYTSPTRVAVIFAMEPVFAALTSFFWIGERLTYNSIAGCLFIFLGMILAELPQKPKENSSTAGI